MGTPADDIRGEFSTCPVPYTRSDHILLGHGSGGQLTADLIRRVDASDARGFALNVSNYNPTSAEFAYAHEIAQILGCREGTAKSHVSRGLTRLRSLLTDTELPGGNDDRS